MNRKVIVLNLALLALVAALVWLLRQHWREAHAHERAILKQPARTQALPSPPPAPALKPIAPAEYLEVAQKTLFSKDRNPTVVIEVPAPKPEPPMPALPHYHGQMAIGDPVVLLSIDASQTQRSYRAGEKVGPFELVSFDHEKIKLDWNGKTVERKLEELAPKEAPPQQPQQQAAAAPGTPAASKPIALGGADDPAAKKNPVLGNDSGGGFFSCVAGENSPSGTVVAGYKKIISRGIFSEVCHWELVK